MLNVSKYLDIISVRKLQTLPEAFFTAKKNVSFKAVIYVSAYTLFTNTFVIIFLYLRVKFTRS